jgi:hypothetical protein
MAQKLIELKAADIIETSSRGKVLDFAFTLAEASINDLRVYVDFNGWGKVPHSASVCVGLANPYGGANELNFSVLTHPLSVNPTDFGIEKVPATARGGGAGYDPVVAQGIPSGELERFMWVQIVPDAGDIFNPTDFVGWISFHDC